MMLTRVAAVTYQAGELGSPVAPMSQVTTRCVVPRTEKYPPALSRSQNPPAVDVAHTTAEESKDACGHRRQAPRAPSTVAGVTWR